MPLVNEHRIIERQIELAVSTSLEWLPCYRSLAAELPLILSVELDALYIVELGHSLSHLLHICRCREGNHEPAVKAIHA